MSYQNSVTTMNRAQPLKGKASSNIVNKHTIVYQDGSQGKAWEQLCTIHFTLYKQPNLAVQCQKIRKL